VRLSEPYLTGTVGLIVRDERRNEFTQVDALRRSRGLKIGVPLDPGQLAASMQRYFGGSDTQFVTVETPVPFLEGRLSQLDAFLWPAEGAAAATLLHPEYSVVVPQPDPVKVSYAFGVAPGSADLADVVNEWIVYARNVGAIQHAYDYWILGKGAEEKRRRWSIMHDVLGWRE
jgi:ABC-type amino acid transport substrate-binding protein